MIAPKELCILLSSFLSIPEERLLDPECKDGLTPKELTDLLIAFYEVNDLSDFFGNVRRLKVWAHRILVSALARHRKKHRVIQVGNAQRLLLR